MVRNKQMYLFEEIYIVLKNKNKYFYFNIYFTFIFIFCENRFIKAIMYTRPDFSVNKSWLK